MPLHPFQPARRDDARKHHLSSFCLSCSCWDMNDNTALWWVIKAPVVGSIMVSVLGTRSREETEAWAERQGRRRNKEVTTQTSLPWLCYILQKGRTSYLALPRVLDIYLYPIFPHYERCY